MSALTALFIRDLRLAIRVGGGAWMGVLFFLIVVALVPFAVGPDSGLLRRIGPARWKKDAHAESRVRTPRFRSSGSGGGADRESRFASLRNCPRSRALRATSGSYSDPAVCCSIFATSPVQPVWWLAPTPEPSSPLKYS